MAIYLVTPLANNATKLNQAIDEAFPNADTNVFTLPSNAGVLVNYSGTSQELGKALFITVGKVEGENSFVGAALIVPFTSYWGRGATTMWDWIKTKLEGQ
jgi:hypothetical protein